MDQYDKDYVNDLIWFSFFDIYKPQEIEISNADGSFQQHVIFTRCMSMLKIFPITNFL